MDEKLTLQEDVDIIKLDGTFKSWKDEYTSDDVEKHLRDNNITDFIYDGICGDGDILLVTNKGILTCISLEDLLKIAKAFNNPFMTIEPYEGELMLTLSWNVEETKEEPKC